MRKTIIYTLALAGATWALLTITSAVLAILGI